MTSESFDFSGTFSSRVLRADFTSLRFGCLIAAIFLYAIFSSPTPDNPGWAEIAIAFLLIAAAGPVAARAAVTLRTNATSWRGWGGLLLLYGLSVPLVGAMVAGHEWRLILRDIAPFLYMLAPLFMADIFKERPRYYRWLAAAFAGLGLVFSLRALADANVILIDLPYPKGELFYLANAASVMFAALWLVGEAGKNFATKFTTRSMAIFISACGLASLPLFAMAWSLERAGIGAMVLYFGILGLAAFTRAPYRIVFIACLCAAGLVCFSHEAMDLAHVLLRKTSLYGFNMRGEEAAAIWRAAGGNLVRLIFGGGWGSTFESPAVAGIRVNYSHCLLTATLLKMGLAGLILTSLYLFALFKRVWALIPKEPALALSLAAPFLIDVFLYASYKSLDFGLLLLLIAAAV